MDLRSHLDDLAQRHPEFAEHLRWPPCSGDVRSNTWGRKRRGSGEDSGEASTKQQQQQPQQPENTNFEQENAEEPGPLRGRPKENLRNTVPDMGQKQQDNDEKEGRGQRSWSAPPDNRTQQPQDKPQRFVSKIEITPVNPAATASQDQQPCASSSPPVTGDAAKPPMPPKQPQQQQQHSQPQHKQSTVRHIPIFVEGRDEPILPRNVEQEFTQTQAPPSSYQQPQYTPHQQFQHQQAPPPPPPPPQPQKQEPKPQPQKQEPKLQKPEQPQQPKQPEPAVNPNDPISRVQIIQKQVDDLRNKIENFKGSRTDKEYIYLDEMLTRNLLKLDDIDTEGKENVRAARKEAIKSIQRCISVLEGKGKQDEMVDNSVQQNTSDSTSETKDEKMDTTPVTTDTPTPSNEHQQQNNENKMETDSTNKTQIDSKNVEPENSTDNKQESENKVPTEGNNMEVENQPNSAAEGQGKQQDPSSTTSS